MGATVNVAVVWDEAPQEGRIEVAHGRLVGLHSEGGRADAPTGAFSVTAGGPGRLVVAVADACVDAGANATRVTVRTGPDGFTCFLRDVNRDTPILIETFHVAVTAADDPRTYREIEAAARAKCLLSESQRIEIEAEETYENACRHTRRQVVPTWLGLSRDFRLFSVSHDVDRGYWGWIEPRYHGTVQNLPESDGRPIRVDFAVGRGASCRVDITRRLDEGALPILHSVQRDGEVAYHLTFFVTLETGPLSAARLRGTDWLAAYANSRGCMLTADERRHYEQDLAAAEVREREEETVCWTRIEAVNTAAVPRYAFFKGLRLSPAATEARYDGARGLCLFTGGRAFGVELLDGRPMPEEEMAILLQPGRTATIDLLVPHQPLPADRAERLAAQDFHEHLEACRRFWREKLAGAAQARLPEPAIEERLRAGLLHLDLVAYGLEPDGPVAATIGWYAPIGSESAPIIQFFDSVGLHDLARRSLQFFLERQREDGSIQTFGGYQLETGPVLWSLGEHYRYTRDEEWLRSIKPNVLKACAYLLDWRGRNKRDDLRGRGWGLLDGKVADPDDFFHSFMLNGVSYLGLKRAVEVLGVIGAPEAVGLAGEVEAYRRDIRAACEEAVAHSPVTPLGDGTWVPSCPPWAEYPGPVALYAEGGQWHTHGAFVSRDSLIGPLYLILGEVLDPRERLAEFILRSHQVLATDLNAGFSQPYYCRHDVAHLRRGEVKAFLKTYYNQMAALQDRETYSFWEHYFHASQHKTHEEGWFLMQTRWMLYQEDGETLRLLPGIPRRWLADGREIVLDRWASYFGPLGLRVRSRVAEGAIDAEVLCDAGRAPKSVLLRLPHPEERRPVDVTGGEYDPQAETVSVAMAGPSARVTLRFE